MSEPWVPKPIAWPKAVLPKGQPGWEESLTRWLDHQLPAGHWRHLALTANPWANVIMAAVGIQHDLANLRADYRQAGQIRSFIGPDTAKALQDAITTEAARLKTVLQHLIYLEHELTPHGAPPQAELGMRGDVSGRP